jgi:hypothetical protein
MVTNNLFEHQFNMKKIFNINIYSSFLAFSVLLLIVSGCKKVNTSDDLSTPRLFKPGGLTVAAAQNLAKVTWTVPLFAAGKKLSYTAEFSKDTLFATTEFTLTTDTAGVTATDEKLAVRKKYYVRVKTNAYEDQPESKWIESSGFSISGTQLFQPVRELEIKETSVTLRFTPTVGLNKITLIPIAGAGQPVAVDVALNATEAAAGLKVLTGLAPATGYSAELFSDTKSNGFLTFTTLPVTVYSVILNPGADLAATIASAANNAVIGLNPGTYNLTAAATVILSKTITLKSTSYNPKDTKVNFKEFTLKGTGAGIKVSGIEFDGIAPGNASYFINLTGAAADADPAQFTSITIENCIIHNTAFCLIRGNRAAVGAHKIEFVKVTNTIGYDNPVSSYDYFTLDKLAFNRLDVTKSTFYNLSRSIISCATVLTGSPAPVIVIDQCDFNNLGSDATKYVILDANTNPVTFTMQNSIIANVPRGAGVQTTAIRASVGTVAFNNNNVFKFVTTPGGTTAIALPATATNNRTTDLGWTASTTDFTLPATSDLRNFSTTGTAIGDPRWAY